MISIFGLFGIPQMEIAGAVIATVKARVLEVIWCVFETFAKNSSKLRRENLIKNTNRFLLIFGNIPCPSSEMKLSGDVDLPCIRSLWGILGVTPSPPIRLQIVKNLVACFCPGLGSGGGIMVGNELGAGRLDTARAYGEKLYKMAMPGEQHQV